MNLRLTISCIALVAAGFVQSALAGDGNDQGQGANGTSYIATITDSNGNFASRGVITLHSDHTMSVIDSGQGGPQFFFSSQLGAWRGHVGGNGVVTGRTIDFDFPNAGVARLDYTIHLGANGSATGTITLTDFPIHANPLDGGGTVVGTFTFTAYSIAP